MSKLATLIGGLLLSQGGRRLAGRHAGKLALAALALQLWNQRRAHRDGAAANPRPGPRSRRRWSGRRP